MHKGNCIFQVYSVCTLALAGQMVSIKGTISFSELIIPVISRSGVNSSLAMPSKHFLRWGWTRSGSLVSDKISNISSLDRKKNLNREKYTVVKRDQWLTNSDSEHYTEIQEGVITSLRDRFESLIIPREEESLCFQVWVQTLLYFL